jgi:virginiamycin B lyase
VGATVVELDLPGPDLPHDLAIDRTGRVLVTGMFTDRILVVDRAGGTIEPVPIPIEHANPRAIEVDRSGDWWVLLGAAQRIARYEPGARRWSFASVGMYGHSIALAPDGGAWTNDHFARAGLRLARVAPVPGSALAAHELTGPAFESAARGPSPIPYELRVAPDGKVWASLLHGNQLVAHDPAAGSFRSYSLPDPDAGPRRFDVDAGGALWIPGYVSSKLYRLDPATGVFTSFPLPIRDALPYVVRVDPRSGDLWIGTGAADAVLRFEPERAAFTVYPVPTRGATMRHLAIDPRNGDVWIAYGASPAIHPTRIARLSLRP